MDVTALLDLKDSYASLKLRLTKQIGALFPDLGTLPIAVAALERFVGMLAQEAPLDQGELRLAAKKAAAACRGAVLWVSPAEEEEMEEKDYVGMFLNNGDKADGSTGLGVIKSLFEGTMSAFVDDSMDDFFRIFRRHVAGLRCVFSGKAHKVAEDLCDYFEFDVPEDLDTDDCVPAALKLQIATYLANALLEGTSIVDLITVGATNVKFQQRKRAREASAEEGNEKEGPAKKKARTESHDSDS